MARYGYKCETCETEEDRTLPMAEYDSDQFCEKCKGKLVRVITVPVIHGLSTSTGVNGWGVAPPANSDKSKEGF
jgi:putative FmdB family regulatory protein